MTKYPFSKVKPLKPMFIETDNIRSARQAAYQYAQRKGKVWKVSIIPDKGIVVTETK